MKTDFKKGYEYFAKNYSSLIGSFDGSAFGEDQANYIDSVENSIRELENSINDFKGNKTKSNILKGFIAEEWHAGTFNISAAKNRTVNRASVLNSNAFGSSDISTNEGNDYSSKFYYSAQKSAKAQSVSIRERFEEYKSKGGTDSLEEYTRKRNLDPLKLNESIYSGQMRLVPKDHLEEAVNILKVKIEKEEHNRPEEVQRYKETLKSLTDKISDKVGNESIALTKEESETIAKLAKKGQFKAEDYNIIASELLPFDILFKESLKAGINAAMISLILKIGPEIYRSIDYLIKNNEIEEDSFKKIGFSALSHSSEAFINGSVSAAIGISIKSGKFGLKLQEMEASTIAIVTVATLNTIKLSYEVVLGLKTQSEMAEEVIENIFRISFSHLGGILGSSLLSALKPLGYMLGSLVGSLVGTFAYNTTYKTTMSFLIETGITLFGCVDQNYTLPKALIKDIGIETFEYETFDYNSFEPDNFEFKSFDVSSFQVDTIEFRFLKRGVIEFNKIGYI